VIWVGEACIFSFCGLENCLGDEMDVFAVNTSDNDDSDVVAGAGFEKLGFSDNESLRPLLTVFGCVANVSDEAGYCAFGNS